MASWITVNYDFSSLGVEENSSDSFVFDTLIPKPITQRYFNLLMEHRRIILSGPSGTGKTYLANKLAEYVVNKSGRKKIEEAVATFNVDHKSSKVSKQKQFFVSFLKASEQEKHVFFKQTITISNIVLCAQKL